MDFEDDYAGDDDWLDGNVTISGRTQLRTELDNAVAAFLAKGGKVEQLDVAATALADGYMPKAQFNTVKARNEAATMKKNVRDRNVVNYIRRCMESPGPLELENIARGTGVGVNKLKKLIREQLADEPRAMELVSGIRKKWRTLAKEGAGHE